MHISYIMYNYLRSRFEQKGHNKSMRKSDSTTIYNTITETLQDGKEIMVVGIQGNRFQYVHYVKEYILYYVYTKRRKESQGTKREREREKKKGEVENLSWPLFYSLFSHELK